uniref:Piwi-like RNA-mediated gene silencing 2 n=1 Tax=Salarias fasciatus TaxID=181472 RepID=A0A672I995_SALFA
MDPRKPPESSDMASAPWWLRGRGLQPPDVAVGHSRGLQPPTGNPTAGRSRGLFTAGWGLTLPMTTDPGVGQARGLSAPHDEPLVGLARGQLPAAPEPQIGVNLSQPHPQLSPAAAFETEKPGPTGDAPTVASPAQGQRSALVSMFRGIDLEASTSWGRGEPPVGQSMELETVNILLSPPEKFCKHEFCRILSVSSVDGRPSPLTMGPGRAAPPQPAGGGGLPLVSPFPPGQLGAASSTLGPQAALHPHPSPSGIQSNQEPPNKAGFKGAPLTIGLNHIPIRCRHEAVYQYHVTFTPAVESTLMRFSMMREHLPTTGDVVAFDGCMLYLPVKLEDVVVLQSVRLTDNEKIQITIQMTKILAPNSDLVIPFYNVVLRRIMKMLRLKLVGRNHYNPENAVILKQHRLQVWPGYETCIKSTDGGLYLSVTVSHKFLRNDSVLDVMNTFNRENFRDECTKELVGSIVITLYNNRTYRVDNIEWEKSPRDSFTLMDGSTTTFADYYSKNYGITIKELDQPLLLHRPKERSKPGGKQLITGEILLVPELCFMTGIPDKMKKDFRVMRVNLMREMTSEQHLHSVSQLLQNIRSSSESVLELSRWGLEIGSGSVQSRILPGESICLQSSSFATGSYASWAREVVSNPSISSIPLNVWVLIFPHRCGQQAEELVSTFHSVSRPMGVHLEQPIRVALQNNQTDTYIKAIQSWLTSEPKLQLVVCIVVGNREDLYSAIKKLCCVKHPVPSQVICINTISQNLRLRSIAQRLLLPFISAFHVGDKTNHPTMKHICNDLMVVGVDVHHNPSKTRRSVMGLVASVNRVLTRWYSTVSFQRSNEELISGFRVCFLSALQTYYKVNHSLPDKIVVYRDGVSETQLKVVEQHEIPQLITCFKSFTNYEPKLTFVVVQKHCSTVMYSTARGGGGGGTPPPGTVLDHTVTSKHWLDFFLISHHIPRGRAVPTRYVALCNTTNLTPDHLQRLTFKLCHLYWNWMGTISVPAPCKYAHKLAYLAARYLHAEPGIQLSQQLFFL